MEIEALIDTGFTGFLTLLPELVVELGLTRLGQKSMMLANGRRDIFDTYGATVRWDGEPRFVDADEADATPLIGMSMIEGHDLLVEVEDGGRVMIQARRATPNPVIVCAPALTEGLRLASRAHARWNGAPELTRTARAGRTRQAPGRSGRAASAAPRVWSPDPRRRPGGPEPDQTQRARLATLSLTVTGGRRRRATSS